MDAVPPLADLLDPARYRLVRELGRGGMGVVYLAHNLPMYRPEVLKVVARAGAADRFATEIRAAARLAHPNVVAAFSTFRAGPLAVLAMEYVEGQDLGRVVDEAGPLPVPTAVGYVLQAAAALQHAHDRGMTHRDVKPSNLMLTPDGTVKVLDFGLAKLARDGGSGTDPSARGRLLGTAGFMAPEQIRDPASADGRADVYSLGCTLYYLLAGGPPFPGHSLLAILAAHQAAPPPPLPDLPPGLWPVIAKMLAKAPADRFPSPAAAAEALAPFAAKERMGERPGVWRGGVGGGN
jgi:serine/threonine protein kinase